MSKKLQKDDRLYYGYPKCCIKQFYDDLDIGLIFINRKDRLNASKNGFVPCTSHAKLINIKKIKIESLVKKTRKCVLPFTKKNYFNEACLYE
jgi:hypothetical protein